MCQDRSGSWYFDSMLTPSVRASAMMASAKETGSIADLARRRAGDTDNGSGRWRRMMTGEGWKVRQAAVDVRCGGRCI